MLSSSQGMQGIHLSSLPPGLGVLPVPLNVVDRFQGWVLKALERRVTLLYSKEGMCGRWNDPASWC